MKLSELLASRRKLIRQATLANLAHAYKTLGRHAGRVALARLHGPVRLRRSVVEEDGGWATLTAMDGRQSVIEEHFTDEDIIELAEAIWFAGDVRAPEIEFAIENLGRDFLQPLGASLTSQGVTIDLGPADILPSRPTVR